MSPLAERLRQRFYSDDKHPYRILEHRLETLVSPEAVLLDAGCGRGAELLARYAGRVRRRIGVDLVDFRDVPAGIETHRADLARMPLESNSVDVIVSRSVFEHLVDPAAVYAEMARVLRPGGAVIFLTANMWDYGTLVAKLIPNRFHASIVKAVEGRAEEDTFPTAYRSNTRAAVLRLARGAGLEVDGIDYLGQYPNYLMFNGFLFFLGTCFEKATERVGWLKGLRGWILVAMRKPAAPD
jgi:SAM-dependent methyltransferase